MTNQSFRKSSVTLVRAGLLLGALSFSLFSQGKNPMILIPGLSGSELRHKDTGERVWFRAFKKAKSEDLRLAISADPTKNHDALIPGDILRSVKIGIFPAIDVYDSFVKAMLVRGGYHEEKWDTPSENGFQDSLYLFPYDWRLDNVVNARHLIQRVNELKRKLNKPNLKFDIVAHSMGGIIARYAAMYGDADLPTGNRKAVPTWAGAKDFDKIILMGTPNEGSAFSLSPLLNGFTIGGLRIELPFGQDTSKFTVFTIPAAYELLPAPGTLRVYNDKLKPIDVDIYDLKVWSKYGWNVIYDPKFALRFTSAERKVAAAYFAAALDRGRRLHEALATAQGNTGGISFYVLGADCKTAIDAIVIYRDEKANKWKTIFRPKGFIRSDGVKVTDDELKKLMLSPGDGIVTSRSLETATQSGKVGLPSIMGSKSDKFICEDHNKLATNVGIQDYIIGILNGKGDPKKDEKEKK